MSTSEPPVEPSADPPKARNRRRIVAIGATVVLLATGGTLIAVAATAQKSPPQPPSSQARGSTSAPTSAATTSMAPKPAPVPKRTTARPTHEQPKPTTAPPTTPLVETPATRGTILAASVPTRIDIPAIGANSQLLKLGTNKDGTIQVPPVEEKNSHAGWYDESPTPGQLGPAVILGHIDSAKYGPGVFFRLGALRPGDKADVTRADGTVAVFTIDKVEEYSKNHFPTHDVYGNLDHAGLRLITCGGKFDPSAHSYESNIVAYASLTSTHKTVVSG